MNICNRIGKLDFEDFDATVLASWESAVSKYQDTTSAWGPYFAYCFASSRIILTNCRRDWFLSIKWHNSFIYKLLVSFLQIKF